MFLAQASSRDYLVALVSECTPGGLNQTTRGDTSFRCQTHLATTNANLRASPPAVSSSLGEFNYGDNKEIQSSAPIGRILNRRPVFVILIIDELIAGPRREKTDRVNTGLIRPNGLICSCMRDSEFLSFGTGERTKEELVCIPKNAQRDLEPLKRFMRSYEIHRAIKLTPRVSCFLLAWSLIKDACGFRNIYRRVNDYLFAAGIIGGGSNLLGDT